MRVILRTAPSSIGMGLTISSNVYNGKNRLRFRPSTVNVVARPSVPVYTFPYFGSTTVQYTATPLNELIQTDLIGTWSVYAPTLINSANKQFFGASPNTRSIAFNEHICGYTRQTGTIVFLHGAVRLANVSNGYARAATSGSGGWSFNGAVYTTQPTSTFVRDAVPTNCVRFMFGNMQADKAERDGDDLIVYLSLSDYFGRGTLSWTSENELVTEVYQEDGEWKARGERVTVTAEITGEHWEV